MGRKSIDGQSEYIQEEKSFIEINTNTDTEIRKESVIPGTNIIQTHMNSQTMSHKTGQKSRIESGISIDEVFPKADMKIKSANPQKTELRSIDDNVNVFGVSDSFGEIHKEDGKFMKQIKGYMAEYRRAAGLYEQKTVLDNLISSCRWYNATHWSYFGKSGKRLKDVKTILEKAKKERNDVVKAINEDEEAIVERRENRRQRIEDLKNNDKLIVRTTKEKESKEMPDPTDRRPVVMSSYWAALKAYTVGLFGRNILNLGMGAIAGTAWLASYPFALLTAGITGNREYYKGFNIRIPRPQSPKQWMRYYLYNRRHVGNAMGRYIKNRWWWFLVIPGKFIQYDIWDPFKHLVTLDMDHLAGGAFIKDTKKEAIRDRADEDHRFATGNIPDYVDDEQNEEEQPENHVLDHYAENAMK